MDGRIILEGVFKLGADCIRWTEDGLVLGCCEYGSHSKGRLPRNATAVAMDQSYVT